MAIKELCSEVEKMDMQYACSCGLLNLISSEPKAVYTQLMKNFKKFLHRVVCELNGLSETKKMDFSKSSLEFCSGRFYDINSEIYRHRFLTYLLIEISRSVEKSIKSKYDKTVLIKSGFYENGYFILKDFVGTVRQFIRQFLRNRPYENLLIKISQTLMYGYKKIKEPKRVNKFIREMKSELSLGLSGTSMKMPDDIAIDTVIKLAFVLTTGQTNFKHLPCFKKIETLNTRGDKKRKMIIVEQLGFAILQTQKKAKAPIIYQSFCNASPRVMTQYSDASEERTVREGVRALYLIKFIFGNRCMASLINRLV